MESQAISPTPQSRAHVTVIQAKVAAGSVYQRHGRCSTANDLNLRIHKCYVDFIDGAGVDFIGDHMAYHLPYMEAHHGEY